jgi:hypothetical protein
VEAKHPDYIVAQQRLQQRRVNVNESAGGVEGSLGVVGFKPLRNRAFGIERPQLKK